HLLGAGGEGPRWASRLVRGDGARRRDRLRARAHALLHRAQQRHRPPAGRGIPVPMSAEGAEPRSESGVEGPGSTATADSAGVVGSEGTVDSAGVLASVGTVSSAGVIGGAGTVASAGVVGSAGVAGSTVVVGSAGVA